MQALRFACGEARLPLPTRTRRTMTTSISTIEPHIGNNSVNNNNIFKMAPIKKEKVEATMSAFERARAQNLAVNQAMMKDLSTSAERMMPKPAGRPKSTTTRKKPTPMKKEEVRPTRTSSRIAGLEADSETAKRKAEVEYEFAKEQAVAKRQRVSGDLNFSDIVVDGKKWSKDDGFLSGIMRGAQPNVRTFTEDDIKETTDESLKALRERMSGLRLYEGYEPNRLCHKILNWYIR